MRIAFWIGTLIGLASLAFLMAWLGLAQIADRLADAHWAIFLVAFFALPGLLLSTAGWRYLFAPNTAPRYWNAVMAMWMGDSVNLLLPVATIGGDLVKVRQLVRYSVPGVGAVTSIVLDKTVELLLILKNLPKLARERKGCFVERSDRPSGSEVQVLHHESAANSHL